MLNKKFIIILILLALYQSTLLSKSPSFDEFNSKNLSKYFSGVVAFKNKDNSEALRYFNSSKVLINQHDPYLEKFIISLVLEDKVKQAINFVRANSKKNNSNFFEAHILLALDSIKKNNINKALEILAEVPDFLQKDRLNFIVSILLSNMHMFLKIKKFPMEIKIMVIYH